MRMRDLCSCGLGSFLLSAVTLAACATPQPEPPIEFCENEQSTELIPLEELDYIAHAGGSPYGLNQLPTYTNSRQAFDVSYANGFRAFEFDLITLGDGTVTLAHDGHEDRYGLKKEFRESTRSDVEGRRYDGIFEVLFAEDLIEMMVEFPDIWIILDSKWDHEIIAQVLVDLAPNDQVRDRMVPHMASADHVEALKDVYAFPEQMIAVYRWAGTDFDVARRKELFDIDNVMMWWDSRWSPATQDTMEAAGLNVWVHTPDEGALIQSFLDMGIRVYSGGLIAPCLAGQDI